MKKTIALVSALAIVFCCSFPAFATTPTGRRREASYDYGDVSLHVSVDAGASVTYNNDVCHYDHRFTVTLTNKTNKFQVADQNILGFKLYTGRNDYFDNTFAGSSGTTQTNASWGAEVTSYSDNMTVPDIKFYTSASSGWEGSVYIKFNDSDLLVLNPNETRTYNFTIDFIASQTTGAMPINGNYVYGYFTYLSNSSISIFNKPNTFTSNTVDNFIANNSFPNSVIAYILGSYEILSAHPGLQDYLDTYVSSNNMSWAFECSRATADYSEYVRMNTQGFRLISSNYDLFNSVNGTNYGNRDLIGAVDLYVHYRLMSKGTFDTIINPINSDVMDEVTFNLNGWKACGTEYTIIDQKGFTVTQVKPYWNSATDTNTYFISALPDGSTTDSGNGRVATFDPSWYLVKITYYFAQSDTTLNDVSGVPQINVTTATTRYSNHRKADYASHTLIWYLRNWWASYSTNQQGAEDVTDSAESQSSTIDNQHQTESNYFSDSQSAIQDTGIQNFKFNPQELSGLNGLKDDFTAVWVSCGTLSRVWITSLTIGLALAIIRHRRMFEK